MGDDPTVGKEQIRPDTERIRSVAAELFAKGDDASIDRAAQLIKTASEAENQAAQAAKFASEQRKLEDDLIDSGKRRAFEDRKTLIAVITPLLTTVVLAITNIAQIGQSRYQSQTAAAAAKQQRDDAAAAAKRQDEAAEDMRWHDALKVMSADSELSETSMLLENFSQSPRYQRQVYAISRNLLVNTKSPAEFKSVFRDIFQPVKWSNLSSVVTINQYLYSKEGPLTDKAYVKGQRIAENSTSNKKILEQYDALYEEIEFISIAISPALKSRRPDGFVLDMSATGFWDCDWSGADLTSADLTGSSVNRVNLKGANLSGITKFEPVTFSQTAWWQARLISPELLKYLMQSQNSPYDPATNYGVSNLRITYQEYHDDLERLKRASGIQ